MDKRLVLKNVFAATSGAEATVELSIDDREVTGQATWSSNAQDPLSVVAEATLSAVAQFLRPEVGLTLGKLMKAPDVLYARIDFRAGKELYELWGISPLSDDHPMDVAKAILSAINRRSALVFAEPLARAGAGRRVPDAKPSKAEVMEPPQPVAEPVAAGVSQKSEWEDTVKDQLAARGLTLDAEGNIIPLPVPERAAPPEPAPPEPAPVRPRVRASIRDRQLPRFASADLGHDDLSLEPVVDGGGGVQSRPSLRGIDGEDLWRLVESLVDRHRRDIFVRLGSPQQTNTVEDIKLAQGELRGLDWIAGLPGREVQAIRTLIGAPS